MDNFDRHEKLRMLLADLSSRLDIVENYHNGLNSTGNSTSMDPIVYDSGDIAWVLFSSALVLFMSLPGIALFYGGMVSDLKGFVAAAMQTLSIACVITFLWVFIGYSLIFAPVDEIVLRNTIIGDLSRIWLLGMDHSTHHRLSPTVPEAVYCMFQLTFAIITPALICGSFAERMKYFSLIAFMGLWHLFVYCPIAHANWHPSGILYREGVLDFAGGNVVHISSGMAALVASIVVGKGFGKVEIKPHNLTLTLIGCACLWIGWFGFNAGSAGAASNRAGLAIICTHIAASLGGLSWLVTTWIITKKPSFLGVMTGIVSGLVAITPAAGYVDPTGAFVIGILSGPICYLGSNIKHQFGFDDSLDAFGIHAIGGVLGGLMTGVFAKAEICGINGALYGNPEQILYQLYGMGFTAIWSLTVTYILLKIIDNTFGLRARKSYNKMGHGVSSKVISSPSKDRGPLTLKKGGSGDSLNKNNPFSTYGSKYVDVFNLSSKSNQSLRITLTASTPSRTNRRGSKLELDIIPETKRQQDIAEVEAADADVDFPSVHPPRNSITNLNQEKYHENKNIKIDKDDDNIQNNNHNNNVVYTLNETEPEYKNNESRSMMSSGKLEFKSNEFPPVTASTHSLRSKEAWN